MPLLAAMKSEKCVNLTVKEKDYQNISSQPGQQLKKTTTVAEVLLDHFIIFPGTDSISFSRGDAAAVLRATSDSSWGHGMALYTCLFLRAVV